MAELPLNELFLLAEYSADLDIVEQELRRASQHTKLADDLLKLQQDAGVAIDKEMGGEPSGAQSIKLWADYAPVTQERLGPILQEAQKACPNEKLGQLMRALNVMPVQAIPAAPAMRTKVPGPKS